MVLHQEPNGSAIPDIYWKRPERRESWSWGPTGRQNKLEVIETELQRLVQHGLDELQVFHTFFRRWVTPLAKRTRSMWEYSGPMDPDRASPEELPKDEVWSRLDRVLQLRDKNSLEGTPSPLHATKLSNLVCPPFCVIFLLILMF